MTFAEWLAQFKTEERTDALAVAGMAGLLYAWFVYRQRRELLGVLEARVDQLGGPKS